MLRPRIGFKYYDNAGTLGRDRNDHPFSASVRSCFLLLLIMSKATFVSHGASLRKLTLIASRNAPIHHRVIRRAHAPAKMAALPVARIASVAALSIGE